MIIKDCMLDLETFGTKPGSVIRSIGAVGFNPREGLGTEFYANITEEDQINLGATKDQSTIDWWKKQSKESQDALLIDQQPLEKVAIDFALYWRDNKFTRVWAQGSNFDTVLWEAVCNMVNIKVPWRFWNTRDTRTAYELAGFNTKSVKREGTYHNALDDSKHQVRCLYRSYQILDNNAAQAHLYKDLTK